jgi:predicted SprT family Zn-dependent metalloprotease
VTIATLKLASMDEARLALLVSHELAHYLMDHQVNRLAVSWFREHVYTKAFKVKSQRLAETDPIKNDFKARTKLQSYSCFYP